MVIQAVRVRRKGQVTLPAGIRNEHGIDVGDKLFIERRGNEIVLTSPDNYVDPLAGVFQKYVTVWNPDVNEENALMSKGMADVAARRDRRSQCV
jgi:AbrB family looped-hinge helix DNA binding protein